MDASPVIKERTSSANESLGRKQQERNNQAISQHSTFRGRFYDHGKPEELGFAEEPGVGVNSFGNLTFVSGMQRISCPALRQGWIPVPKTKTALRA